VSTPSTKQVQSIDDHILINSDDLLKQSLPAREKFRILHEERLWVVNELDRQRSELQSLATQRHDPPAPVPQISEEEYKIKVNDIDAKIRQYETQQNDKSLTETQRAGAGAQLLDLTRQKARAALELTESRTYDQERHRIEELERQQQIANTISKDASNYLTRIDAAIAELMTSNNDDSRFRLEMGIGFLLLVTLLIGCFFWFAFYGGSMREILRNDRGLQFITLFSLVIAITLFGLLNILEGKELAALLGGLSGYILGRSNIAVGPEQRQEVPQAGAGQ
jgi:hypothetical protein